jgi:site-specific recombinase XerD
MGIKIVLRKRKNADGTRPLILQVWKNGKASTTHLDYSIKTEDWDKKAQRVKTSHPNSVRLNNFLRKKLADATDSALELEGDKKQYSSKAVIKKIKPKSGSTFFAQANDYLETLRKAGKYSQYTSDKPRIGHFREFLNDEDIAFSDMTPGLLTKFVVFLKSYHKRPQKKKPAPDPAAPKKRVRKSIAKPKKPMSERTVMNHLAALRSVFGHARNNQVVKKEQSPFGEGGVKIEFPETNKIPIDAEDVANLEKVELLDPAHDHARKLWLFSFYFAGMRISDELLLRWPDFTNYRLHYAMGKNDKADSLKIPDKAVTILKFYEQFKEHNDDLIFPDLKGVDLDDEFNTKRAIAFRTSTIDKILRLHVAPAAGITKKLTMHISRHTFANLAGDAIPVQMLQKLYRHSDIKTTIGYQANFINKPADDALDAVIGKVKHGEPKLENF